MNVQLLSQIARGKLAQAGVVVLESDCFYIGDDSVVGKIPADVEYRIDQHDPDLGLIQIVFLVLEEAEYEDL